MSEKKPEPKIAFAYPGQGSSRPQMAAKTVSEKEYGPLFDYGADILREEGFDVDLRELCFRQEEPIVGQLDNQLAIYMTNYAADKHLQKKMSVSPDYVVGHSIGEYNAFIGSRVLDLSYALPLVAHRATAMEDAASQMPEAGGIAVITRLSSEIVEKLVEKHDAEIGNYNNPEQTTAVGLQTQLDAIAQEVEKIRAEQGDRRIRFIQLEGVNVPVHSRWM
ncbi:MAG TPA: acyltransferase domain-containing protein, partial [Candidatus Saccharimonadales bacterium]|nr:acyltransferase domain-containing protein [Candidatus Saccharimonadales bacterium]